MLETPKILNRLPSQELKEIKYGDKVAMQAERAANFQFFQADNLLALGTGGNQVILSVSRLDVQNVTLVGNVTQIAPSLSFEGKDVTVESSIVEVAQVRVSRDTALELAVAITAICARDGVDPNLLRQKFELAFAAKP